VLVPFQVVQSCSYPAKGLIDRLCKKPVPLPGLHQR